MIEQMFIQSGDEFCTLTLPGLALPCLVGPRKDFESVLTRRTIHDPGYLNQGGPFDSIGNKGVEHLSFSGQLLGLGTDCTYERVRGWPSASFTGDGYRVPGRRDGREVMMRGYFLLHGSDGSAAFGGTYPDEFKDTEGYSMATVVWTYTGMCAVMEVVKTAHYENRSGTIEHRSVWSYRINLSERAGWHSGTYQMVSSVTTYSDGRKVNLGPTSWTNFRYYLEWLSYAGPGCEGSGVYLNTLTYNDLYANVQREIAVNQHWSHACQGAINSGCYLDINMIAMLKDLTGLRADLGSLLESGKKLTTVNLAKKKGWQDVSGFFLANKYGYQLTLADAKKIGDALERLRQNLKIVRKYGTKLRNRRKFSFQWRGQDVNVTLGYIAFVTGADDPLTIAIQKLYEWDLYPSLGNMWDLVPYSFVVDWFLSIGDLLESVDTALYKRTLRANSISKSLKIEMPPVEGSEILHLPPYVKGCVGLSLYRRWGESSFDPMPFSIESDLSGLNGHWVEGAALVIQKV